MPGPAQVQKHPDWQDSPFNSFTFEQTVQILRGAYGAQVADGFQTWAAAAWKKDPALTPNQAVAAYFVGSSIAGGAGAAAAALGKIPAAAAKGAETLPAIANPLDFLRNIAAFFDKLGEANTWLRIGEFLIGAALITVGLAKLASGTAAGRAAAKIATKAALL